MKKYLGQIIFNFLAAVGVVIFSFRSINDSALLTIAAIVGLMTSLSVRDILFVIKMNTSRSAFQPDYVFTEQTLDSFVEAQDYIEIMKGLKNYSPCSPERHFSAIMTRFLLTISFFLLKLLAHRQ